jgi:hypothetical protein
MDNNYSYIRYMIMGNSISNKVIDEYNTCFICWENVETQQWSKCVKCNIVLHNLCEERYRGEKTYCECPHCRRIGTIYLVNNRYLK